MKKYGTVILWFFFLCSFHINAQTVNWNDTKQQKHLANIHLDADYALGYGIGYSYRLTSKRPVFLNAEYTAPFGKKLADDNKIKTGAQVHWLQSGHFHLTSKLQGVFRRYHSDYARLLNFGADLSVTGGYYQRRWFIGGELGFDKAIITHFKHSALYKESFPGVKDGWYEPSTGGNIYYGILGGWSGKNNDVYLKLGKLVQQDFNSSPMLPVYGQIGLNIKMGRK